MPSFRSRVLDALDIKKETVKIQVNERFPKTHKTDADGYELSASGSIPLVNYAISKQLQSTEIGPSWVSGNPTKTKLDVLGFVLGKQQVDGEMTTSVGNTEIYTYKNSYPVAAPTSATTWDPSSTYTGFHCLNGIYDDNSKALKHIRKSSVEPLDLDTQSYVKDYATLPEHTHKDWPDNVIDQAHLLNENPYADSLFYHSVRMSFLISGITIPDIAESASNHRGLVRMLVIKPKMPSVRVRFTGDTNSPIINMKHPPHFDTELFYSGKRTLGGRMDNAIYGHVASGNGPDQAHLSPTFGLTKRNTAEPNIDVRTGSIHYGHPIPSEGSNHTFTAYDVMTSPINRDAYTVIVDKTFSLDTLHHGVASQRLENVTIPINNRIKFPGRIPGKGSANLVPTATANGVTDPSDLTDPTKWGSNLLTEATNNEPLNMHSRPIIMFLSMDQKLSCQVTGYTAITET